MSISADGYVTTPDGWPAQLAVPAFVSGESYGIREFLEGVDAALMGRTTFEPALSNPRWPWPSLDVFVLASHRPAGTPEGVVTDSDPERLLAAIREALGDGMRPTPSLSLDSKLTLERQLPLPGGSVEIVY
jgi:dihydrofolate reductase